MNNYDFKKDNDGDVMEDTLFANIDDTLVKIDAVVSDTHFSHKNIAKYTGRPFDNSETTEAMNEALKDNWNNTVAEDEKVLALGDMALGNLEQSLQIFSELNGEKLLVPGNHDGISTPMKKRYKKIEKFGYDAMYEQYFTILPETGIELVAVIDGVWYDGVASHYPPFVDFGNIQQDRFADLRPALPDVYGFVLHGHTHSHDILQEGFPNVFHMGVDAHGLSPVRSFTVLTMVKEYLRTVEG